MKKVQEDLTGFGHKVVLCRPQLEQGRSRVRFDEWTMSGRGGRQVCICRQHFLKEKERRENWWGVDSSKGCVINFFPLKLGKTGASLNTYRKEAAERKGYTTD